MIALERLAESLILTILDYTIFYILNAIFMKSQGLKVEIESWKE